MQTNKLNMLQYLSAIVIILAILLILLIEAILNLTPPVSRDALIHHLAIPKLWLKHGGFYEIKWASFSYFPMNVDLLYLFPLYLNKDFLAKFIHMGFGLGTAFLIFNYLKKRVNLIAGLLGVLIFLSTPAVFRLSTEAYVDLGLVFFTTASLLAMIRYCDDEFKSIKWLLISAICMGLALGTKYNALMIWFFLTLTIVFIHSRRMNNQWHAIKCGFIFFFVSLLVFSPWLIKNYILTGNPFYPLMRGLFNVSSFVTDEGTRSIVYGHTYMGLFQMRESMFGEGFIETLLIPFRYFFQGQDNSARYFDGVLNPLLILLVPFAFMNKQFLRDKLLFMILAAFIILTTTFLDHIRIRYILPAIPFLCILCVIGFVNIWNWVISLSKHIRYVLAALVLSAFTLALSQNAFYIKNYYSKIAPWNYVTGRETRDAFISRHSSSYPVIKYINESTPKNSRIRLLFLGRRGYYLDRIYEADWNMGMNFIRGFVNISSDPDTFQKRLNSLGHTHWLIRKDLFYKFLEDNYSPDVINIFFQRTSECLELIYDKNGYAVYRIIQTP